MLSYYQWRLVMRDTRLCYLYSEVCNKYFKPIEPSFDFISDFVPLRFEVLYG